mmetsp:Transcript_21245/g.49895  ORF Transcript_21245/g.49895 Transcript_21245/m.49895 type:complete len:315 (+) Transcript_21245:102-1046(+)
MGQSQGKAVEIDFEGATPSTEDSALHARVTSLLEQGNEFLAGLAAYGDGSSDLIREALSEKDENLQAEKQERAMAAVSERVSQMKVWYDFSKEIEDATPALLSALAGGSDVGAHQGLASLATRLFDFVLRFDDLKMGTPSIMNDLAYYRRVLGKARAAGGAAAPSAAATPGINANAVNNDDAGRCQMFLSAATPMMTAIHQAMKQHSGNEAVLNTLPTLANSCCHMVAKHRFSRPDTNERCLRGMVGAIVLYDHVHPLGSYHRRSALNIRRCVTLLRTHDNPPPPPVLLNFLKYSSKHLSDDSTPSSIKKLLAG